MSNLEKDLQNQVKAWLNKHRIYHRRTQGGFNSGYPDIEVFHKGQYIGLELKRPDKKGKATLQQKKVMNDLKQLGFTMIIVESLSDIYFIEKL